MSAREAFLSVSEFNELLKRKFDQDEQLRAVYLKGEVSNWKLYSSGHAYFSIKDEKSVLSCIMWRDYVSHLSFMPKDGDEILIFGQVSVYPAQGKYQLYAKSIQLYGKGLELLKLEELKKKLQKEGLFDPSRKRPLPKYPEAIGIITAKGSAAIKDMVFNIQNRFPLPKIYVFPSLVQGKDAPADLLRAFKLSQEYPIDVLIIGRGGGSSEDLGAFNDETLVRALATSKCPTVSAVGHEIDTSLTDYVADVKVSTPTGAAVAVVPDMNIILQDMEEGLLSAGNSIRKNIIYYQERLRSLKERPSLKNPEGIYLDRLEKVKQLSSRLGLAIKNRLAIEENRINSMRGKLEALSPYKVLERGYSIMTGKDGKPISSVDEINPGEVIINRLSDGIIYSEVSKKEKNS